jgi:galactokinase
VTGAGWGGSVVILADGAMRRELEATLGAAYEDAFPERTATVRAIEPSDGVTVRY